jgi:hypothetical protein
MLNYKILYSFIISFFLLSIVVGISYSQVPSISNNSSSSSSLSPEYIVKKFMTMGGQLPINDSQLTGVSQGIPSNNTPKNNTQINSSTVVSSQDKSNNLLDLPKIYKSTVPLAVVVTSYNSSNHTIFKTGSGFIYNFNSSNNNNCK